jgi:hypothetical protein
VIHLGPRACRELLGEQRFFLSNRDGGWDLDLVVGNSIQQLSFFERLASGSPEKITGASNPFNGIDVGSYAAPAVADWDGDGGVNLVAWLAQLAQLAQRGWQPNSPAVRRGWQPNSPSPSGKSRPSTSISCGSGATGEGGSWQRPSTLTRPIAGVCER